MPFLYVRPDRDTVNTGDTVRYFFIAGDNNLKVDSVFGFYYYFETDYFKIRVQKSVPLESDLGTIPRLIHQSVNSLYPPGYGDYFINLLIARKDQDNSYLFSDTIGYAEILVVDSSGVNNNYYPGLRDVKAITAGGYPISLNVSISPIHIISYSNSTGIINNDFNPPNIFPNPFSDELGISHLPIEEVSIKIYSLEGKVIYSNVTHSISKIKIDLREESEGMYVLEIRNSQNQTHRKKIIKTN